MRDILVTLIVFFSLPFIVREPAIGVLMWVWISVMNPHTQGWGFATHFPFAYIVAIVTIFSLILSRSPKRLPITSVTFTLIAFVFWMNITNIFALLPEQSWAQWNKVMKIMLMTFVTLMTIRTKKDLQRLIWVIVLSLSYYGVKGGIFTIKSGGAERVWGPEGTFIGDNNAIALALIICIPLMYYLQQGSSNKWVRHGMVFVIFLSAVAALGSYSRGALLAIIGMGVFVWLKSRNKIAVGAIIILFAPLFFFFMPERWGERMESISEYEADGSAMGRINAWHMAYNLAKDRFFGGGFEVSDPGIFFKYAPKPVVQAAHSIYFQALGEHGFIGLALYLLLGIQTWRMSAWIIKQSKGKDNLYWASTLSMSIQASIIGFALGGTFLSLLYFDVPYYLMVAIVIMRVIVAHELKNTCITQANKPRDRHSAALKP
jgi:putative inorganic carbon (hco3(-)) transporter